MTNITFPYYKSNPPDNFVRVFHAPERATNGANGPGQPPQLREGQGGGKPVADRVKRSTLCVAQSTEGEACTRDIKGHFRFDVYPGYVDLRPNFRVVAGRKRSHKKKPIHEFSRKSRCSYMKRIGRIPENHLPELWQDFTFADDVMKSLTIKERAIYSAETWHRFRKRVKRHYPGMYAIARKEWQIRKSGILIGQAVGHFHVFFGNLPIPWYDLVEKLAVMWVECTKTTERAKALSVALHEKSYRQIKDTRQAMSYAMAYTKKEEYVLGDLRDDESIGRAWMTIGEVPEAFPESVIVSDREEIIIRRLLPHLVNKKRKQYRASLRKPGAPSFVAVRRETILRMITYARMAALTTSS